MTIKLFWNAGETPQELHSLLQEYAAFYPIEECEEGEDSDASDGLCLSFEHLEESAKNGLCEVEITAQRACIRYVGHAQAARGLGAVLSGVAHSEAAAGRVYREQTTFTMLGIMLDCSRNAVKTYEHLQLWLRRLALLGYNMVMLYTEDTYELPDEPYFGYQRGAFTQKELRDIDDYADRLNIEIIPCIQTLGHCEKFLRHPAYADIRDTHNVMLIGAAKTYALIEKMILHWKETCRTDRIHVGMDEAQGMGLGAYYKKHGPRDHFELFNEHLDMVVEICKKHGMKPMIWSDMYFSLGAPSGEYYDKETVVPQAVADTIPAEAQLVYWDYYHQDKAFYLDWIARHRAMGKEPLMASGVWTWNKYWYDQDFTESKAGPCIEACVEAGVHEMIFTQWGDNGNYCDHDSAFAGMLWCADKSYGHSEPQADVLEQRFAAICGGSYAAHCLASDLQSVLPWKEDGLGAKKGEADMWADPFFETAYRSNHKDDAGVMKTNAQKFTDLASELSAHVDDMHCGSLQYAYATAKAFGDRYHLIADIIAAYKSKDAEALAGCRQQIPAVRASVAAMALAFRSMWLRQNKPQGLEEIQARFGMVDARYAEMELRIGEYLGGVHGNIPELDCLCPPTLPACSYRADP